MVKALALYYSRMAFLVPRESCISFHGYTHKSLSNVIFATNIEQKSIKEYTKTTYIPIQMKEEDEFQIRTESIYNTLQNQLSMMDASAKKNAFNDKETKKMFLNRYLDVFYEMLRLKDFCERHNRVFPSSFEDKE